MSIFADWIKALRSGDYLQGTEFLCSSDQHKQYCCLGVLAEIHPKLNYQRNEGIEGSNWHTYSVKESDADHSEHYLPHAILPMPVQRELAEMNDSGDYDFNSMADYIESDIIPRLNKK